MPEAHLAHHLEIAVLLLFIVARRSPVCEGLDGLERHWPRRRWEVVLVVVVRTAGSELVWRMPEPAPRERSWSDLDPGPARWQEMADGW
jgi:hypothetical protein